MNEEIRVGDLVMIVRYPMPCNCNSNHLGKIFTVRKISTRGITCYCNTRWLLPGFASALLAGGHVPVSWLKKIPPLSEPEHSEQKQTEPA